MLLYGAFAGAGNKPKPFGVVVCMANKTQQTESDTFSIEDLAGAITRVDAAFKKIEKSGVSTRMMCVLINDLTGGRTHGVGIKQIERVLLALPKLKETYLTEGK